MSQPNIDPGTGIRYGVICPSFVENWYEFSHAVIDDKCPQCGSYELDIIDSINGGYICEGCKATYAEDESEDITQVGRTYTSISYKANQVEEGDHIVVSQSPYFTYARLCAPTYPNAGDLDSAVAMSISDFDGFKTYCLGHKWFEGGEAPHFEGGIAPYPVYRVSDGLLIPPPIYEAKRKKKTKPLVIEIARSISLDF